MKFLVAVLSQFAVASGALAMNADEPSAFRRLRPYICQVRDPADLQKIYSGKVLTADTIKLRNISEALDAYLGDDINFRDFIKSFAEVSGYNFIFPSAVVRHTFDIPSPGVTTVGEMNNVFFEQLDRLQMIAVDTGRYVRLMGPCAETR